MFRSIRRKKNEISIEETKKILKEARRGVLSLHGDDGYPYGVPINFYYDEEENKIFFHGARVGHKVDSLKACDKVSFTVLGEEEIREEKWAPFVASAILFGRCRMLEDASKIGMRLRQFAGKYYPNEALIEEEILKSGKAVCMFEIEIEHMSGKRIEER